MSDTILRGSGRPEGGYFQVDGKRVPSVTTITSRFKDSGGLIKAANRVGLEGKTLEQAWYGPSLSIGTQVHEMVEATLNGETPEQPSSLEAIAAYDAWFEWWRNARLTVVATELPLVSEAHKFGGTIDSVLRNDKGAAELWDWKTSNGIFAEQLLQAGAYGILWNEHYPDDPITRYNIARFSKEEGDFEHRVFASLNDAAELFLILRNAYELQKALDKRAR